MTVLLANNVSSALAAPITASATSMTVTNGSRFPVLTPGQYFYATIIATNGIVEIVKVNTRNGNAMSITRAQDGTNAQAFASGARVEMRINAASVKDVATDTVAPIDARLTTAEGDITTLEGRMTTAEGDIVALEAFDTALATSTGSTSVGFLQAGSGASLRTVQSKLREWVSVKDFGATGDGVTDDTTAIQACWDYCRINKRTAWVPTGVYRIGQTNVAYGMSVIGEAGATFKMLDNQPKFTRMLTTQNNLWSATSPTEDSPVLYVSGLIFDGNRVNQGAYTGYEKEQQMQLFLTGGPGNLLNRPRLRAVVDNCVFKESCSDGVSVWHDVDVSISNCFFWNMFRGSVVIIGGNNFTRVTNIIAGGDVHNSFFQVEQEDTLGGELTLTNSIFEPLRNDNQSGVGADFGFKQNSKVTVSNCIFNAGVTNINGNSDTSRFTFDNCIFRQLTGLDNLVSFGQTTFNNCQFINTLANTTQRIINYRSFGKTNLRLAFTNCEFTSEFDPLTYLPSITITNVTAISNGVFEFTTSTNHGFTTPGNYTQDYVLISGLTEDSYNKWYWLAATPTPTTFRVNVTEYVGAPALGASPSVRLANTTYIPVAIQSTVGENLSNKLSVSNCTFSDRIFIAVSLAQGGALQDFSGNVVNSIMALAYTSSLTYPVQVCIGSNTFNCSSFITTQGNISANDKTVFYSVEIPARSAFCRFSISGLVDSQVVGKVSMISNRAKPNNSQQLNKWMSYQYSIGSVGSPTVYANNGTAWYAQTTTTLRSTTANRPTLSTIDIGQMYFDTTLDADGKPIWWTGTAWVDATGATV